MGGFKFVVADVTDIDIKIFENMDSYAAYKQIINTAKSITTDTEIPEPSKMLSAFYKSGYFQVIDDKLIFWGKALDLATDHSAENQEIFISQVLHELLIYRGQKGHKYISEAIIIGLGDPSALESIKENVYSVIAKRYNVKWQNVKKLIWDAVQFSLTRAPINVLREYFGYDINLERFKPTPAEFIQTLCNYIKLNM